MSELIVNKFYFLRRNHIGYTTHLSFRNGYGELLSGDEAAGGVKLMAKSDLYYS
jgi:hypothetical protein